MKTIQISDVHNQMLIEVAKRNKQKPNDFVETLIQEVYNAKKKWDAITPRNEMGNA